MNNGFVPPSGLLEPVSIEKMSAFNKNYNNSSLRLGVIIKIHEATDETNISKVLPEYDIITNQQNGGMGQTFVRYSNCMAMDSLGGIADFFEKKLRTAEGETFSKTHDFAKQNGTLVLVLFADGFTDKGIILGGFQNSARKTNLTKEAGLHLEGEYNGLNWKIDKEGALTITFNSPTDNEGNPIDDKLGGSFLSFDKEGSINFTTDEETNLKLNKTTKDISVSAGNNISVKSTKDTSIEATGKVTVKSTADLLMDSGGAAIISSKSAMTVESKGELTIKGSDITLQGKGSVKIKGKTVDIDSPKINLGKGGTPAVTLKTKFIGVGNLGAPVVASAVGPFSTAVFIK